ncbi:placenta-specific gene 8 protein [Ictalurus punctatus]|uniref:Cornifelin B n=1 Tax=Ictalurus punctatus TaxID=7998 RepID=W5U831_ICTPU|nr:placenta-specific gene 8 protein [Ictalurus punctatus]
MAATTVVIQQQPMAVPRVTAWSSGLFHCCQDMDSCCLAFWCFPCFTCKTSSKFGESLCLPLVDLLGPLLMAATGLGICVPPVTLSMRVAIRHKYQIPGSLCEDILVSCFCVTCSWCQMNREISHRKRTEAVMSSQPMTTFNTVTSTVPVM